MTNRTSEKRSPLSKMTPGRWLALVLVVLAAIFIFQNTASTTVQLFGVSIQTPLWFTLLVVFVIGWIAGWLSGRRKPAT